MDTRLHSRSLEFIHPAEVKLYTHRFPTPYLHSTLCFSEFDSFRFPCKWVTQYWSFWAWLILVSTACEVSSTLPDFAGFLFFLKADCHPIICACMPSFFSHCSILASISRLSGIRLQWTWEWGSLSEILDSVSCDVPPEQGLLDHMLVPGLIFWGSSVSFSTDPAPFCVLPTSDEICF